MAITVKEQNSPSLPGSSSSPNSSGINVSLLSSLGIALVIHIIIALAIGSYVVFEGIVPVPFFNSEGIDVSTQSAVIEDMPTLIEETPLPQLQAESLQVVQEEAGGSDAPDMSDLITVSISTLAPTFSMPTTVGNPGVITGSFLGGSGTGSGGGVGGGKVKLGSLFGSRGLGAGTLTGAFYDLKQTPDQNLTELGKTYAASESRRQRNPAFATLMKSIAKRWDPAQLQQDFYKAEVQLSTSQLIIPTMDADQAPKAFEVEKKVRPAGWLIRYTGEIRPPRAGTYRFVGQGDDVLIVRIDDKDVLDASLEPYSNSPDTRTEKFPHYTGASSGRGLWAGKWLNLRASQTYPIEIIIGEAPGGYLTIFLMVQEKGVEYKNHPNGYPLLPPFQTAPTEIPDYPDAEGFQVLKEGLVFPAK